MHQKLLQWFFKMKFQTRPWTSHALIFFTFYQSPPHLILVSFSIAHCTDAGQGPASQLGNSRPWFKCSFWQFLALMAFLFQETQSSGLDWVFPGQWLNYLSPKVQQICCLDFLLISNKKRQTAWNSKLNFSFSRFAYTALDSDCLEERPVSTLLSAIKSRLLARKYQQLWQRSSF